MRKEKKIGILQLISFVFKTYYKNTGLVWQVYTLAIFNILSEISPILSAYVLCKVIDSIISISQSNGDIYDLTKILIIFSSVAILDSLISYAYGCIDVIQTLWLEYLNDKVQFEKYLTIEPKAYEDPEFSKDKSLIEWNLHKVSATTYESIEVFGLIIGVVVAMLSVTFNIIFIINKIVKSI
jgi:ABC-type multidrug transport system fused ATPase/permease subunit